MPHQPSKTNADVSFLFHRIVSSDVSHFDLHTKQLLNAVYEEAYPGLRYVTFVNGRPRSAIVPEIEVSLSAVQMCMARNIETHYLLLLCYQSSLGLNLPPPSPSTPEPRLHSLREGLKINVQGSSAWREQLQKGLEAMWTIAHHRLGKMNVA